MPESLGIGYAAVEGLGSTKIQVDILPMHVQANQEDSTRAAERMVKLEVGCLVTLGGDGTNRAVFKECGSHIPILPISTRTNNGLPQSQAETPAGLAAAR